MMHSQSFCLQLLSGSRYLRVHVATRRKHSNGAIEFRNLNIFVTSVQSVLRGELGNFPQRGLKFILELV
jgi:hypothetical protein